MKSILLAAIFFLDIGFCRLLIGEDDVAKPDDMIGIWHVSGQTILSHNMRETGVTEITKEQKEELMPLAEEVGTCYRLIMRSDGKWEFSTLESGPLGEKDREIFSALLGKPITTEFHFRHRLPINHKEPLSGKWSVAPDGGLTHSGMVAPYSFRPRHYPANSPGKITVKDRLMTFYDDEGNAKMVFKFVRKYKNDPDPKHRPQE